MSPDGRKTIFFLERNVDGTIGGSYRSLLYLVQRLPRDRWRPVVAFYRDHELVPEFRKAASTVHIVPYPTPVRLVAPDGTSRVPLPRVMARLLQKAFNARGSAVLWLRYLALLRREGVDLVHMNNGVATSPELLAASRFLRLPVVAHQRGIGALPPGFARQRDRIDYVICVSDAARENLVQQGIPAVRCRTVHNGIDPDEFTATIKRPPAEVRRALGIPDHALIVGNAGMIRGWKGQLVLVEAMARLRDAFPDAYCLLVGGVSDRFDDDVKYAERIRRFVDDHGLASRVIFAGYQSRVADFVQVFDVMVHTAVDPEPFSRSVLEGMTLGRPMVATRTGGTPEAIEDGVSGLLVPPNDPVAMADAIAALLRDPVRREALGLQAARRARERFSISANVTATQEVYDQLLSPPRRSSIGAPSPAGGAGR